MSFPQLSETRSALTSAYLLQTPDTFVRTVLPGMQRATAVVHANPALGASFTQYSAELEAGGTMGPTPGQRFVYVLEGGIVAAGLELDAAGYAFFSEGDNSSIQALSSTRLVVIEKTYRSLSNTPPPGFFSGRESKLPWQSLLGDDGVQVRSLMPPDFSYDFAVNTMSYQPGASLSMVEIHVMEHGLLMLEGSGIYRLADRWHPVAAGDFIWMAPYCPQWFGALGKTPAKYIIYKDWNRHPL